MQHICQPPAHGVIVVFLERNTRGVFGGKSIRCLTRPFIDCLQVVFYMIGWQIVTDFEIHKIAEHATGVFLVEIHTAFEERGIGHFDVMPAHQIADDGLQSANFENDTEHVFIGNRNYIPALHAFAADQENTTEKIAQPIILGGEHQYSEKANHSGGL